MANNKDKRIGWHFLPASKILTNGDGRTVKVGQVLSCTGYIQTCSNGMHASDTPAQAARYGRGPVLCRVEVTGEIKVDQGDKFAGRSRKVLWMKELKNEDFARLGRELGVTRDLLPSWGGSVKNVSITDLVARLSSVASSKSKELSKWLENWAAANGCPGLSTSTVRPTIASPELDEKAIKDVLMKRTVRTAKEMRADLQGFDLDNFDDVLYDMISDGDVLEVESFTKAGASGYLLGIR